MKEEKKYSGSKTRNYFTAYLLASIQGRRLRYLEKQQKRSEKKIKTAVLSFSQPMMNFLMQKRLSQSVPWIIF